MLTSSPKADHDVKRNNTQSDRRSLAAGMLELQKHSVVWEVSHNPRQTAIQICTRIGLGQCRNLEQVEAALEELKSEGVLSERDGEWSEVLSAWDPEQQTFVDPPHIQAMKDKRRHRRQSREDV